MSGIGICLFPARFDQFLGVEILMGDAPVKEWTQILGTSSNDSATSVSTASDGSVYIAGWTYGDLDGKTNSGINDAFLSKYNKDGSKEWTKLLGTSSNDSATSVDTAFDGSVYVAGFTYGDLDGQTGSGYGDAFLSKYYEDGSKAWTRLLGTPSFEHLSSASTAADGSVYILGTTAGNLDGQPNDGYFTTFLSKKKSISRSSGRPHHNFYKTFHMF